MLNDFCNYLLVLFQFFQIQTGLSIHSKVWHLLSQEDFFSTAPMTVNAGVMVACHSKLMREPLSAQATMVPRLAACSPLMQF